MIKKILSEEQFSSFFLILPLIYTLLSFTIFTYPLHPVIKHLLPLPLYTGLILLLIGSSNSSIKIGSKLRMIGWIIFSFYWATQPLTLYYSEQEDLINALIIIIGIFVLFYFSYREWWNIQQKQYETSLQWIAGASAIAGLIYFIIEQTSLAPIIINSIAWQSGMLLQLFTGNVSIDPPYLTYQSAHIRIIFACTAIQSMVIFVGMILPLRKISINRKIKGLLVTVIPIYFLNLIRNAGITYLVGIYGDSFFSIAHNYIGKGGSLLALIILLLIVTKIVPEIFDQIIELVDQYKKPGPLEIMIKRLLERRKS
jgi:archaeosortase A (PGF-CTERM-specific)